MVYHTAAGKGRAYLTVRARDDVRHGREACVAQSGRRNSERDVVSLVWLFSTVLNQLAFASEIEAFETPNK